jgi:uncharacterized RDD family membrane protein YckC
MDTSTSTLRDQGVQALRQGNIDSAVDLLARAVMADSQDAEAQAFLGVAYSQKGLHVQAKRALQTAVELQPGNASFQFNLGVALEHAGDRIGAASAYQAAIQLNPEHAQARSRLQTLGASTPTSPTGAGSPAPPQANPTATAPEPPWLMGQNQASAGPSAGPQGTVQCPHCKQYSKPGLSCEWCSSPLKSAPAPSTAPWLQGSYSSAGDAPPREIGYSTAPEMSSGEAFGRRFAAYIIDGFLLGVVNQVLIMFLVPQPAVVPGTLPNFNWLGSMMAYGMGIRLLTMGVYGGVMLAMWGRTLGKMALGLRVVGPDGNNPSFWRAALRDSIGKFISGLVLGLGYFWMIWDEGQQTWHDKIAGTYVERA